MKKLKKRVILLLICVICLSSIIYGCQTPNYVSNDNDVEIRQQLAEIQPFRVGDAIGGERTRYFGTSTKWWCTGIGVAGISVASFFFPPAAFGIPVVAGLGYGTGCALEAYYGGPYDYSAYRIPEGPELVVFWFSGADEGAFAARDYIFAKKVFGDECVAMFNFSDVDKALTYAEKLPSGTQLIVRGHSMGGSSAVKFVKRLPRHLSVLLLDTRDPTSWFGHVKKKPDNVQFWRNVLPGDARIFTPEEGHLRTKYIGGMNAANIFMMLGRPWGICPGAQNIVFPKGDHHDVGRYE